MHGLEEAVKRLAQKHELGLQVRVNLHVTSLSAWQQTPRASCHQC